MNSFFKFRQMPLLKALQILSEDISKACNEPNFEKAKNYSDHFSEILLFIFGIENQADSNWMEKVYENYSKVNRDGNLSSQLFLEEYNFLIFLLSPPDPPNAKNLFTFVFANFYQEKRYEFEVKRLPQNTQFLIEKKRFENPIMMGYLGLLDLGKNAISPDGKRLILSIHELFIFVVISSLKNFIGKNPVDLKTPADYYRDDFEVEFLKNPYLVILRRYLEYFYKERKQKYGKTFKLLLFLLQDFLINDYIYSPIVTNQLNSMRNTQISKLNSRNAMFFDNRSIRVPKPHILQAIYLVIHYFLKNNDSDIELKRNDFLINNGFFAKSFYHFLINVLEAWNQDINNNANLLSFVGRVWLKFLAPWEINESYCPINVLNQSDSGKQVESQIFGEILKEFRHSAEMFKRENQQFISHYLKENVLFYTHVLGQFIITFSDQNEIHYKDVIFLKHLTEFFMGSANEKAPIASFFNGIIKVNWIKQLPTGGNNKIEGSLDVMQYIDFMGAQLHNLNLFNDEAITSRVFKTIANLTRFLETFKKKKTTGYLFQKSNNQYDFLIEEAEKTVGFVISQLLFMFSIEGNQADTFYDELNKNQEVIGKAHKHIKNNPNTHLYLCWETPMAPEESEFLYNFYIQIARVVDYFLKKKSVGYNTTYPITNLRILVNPNNTIKFLIVVSILLLVLYLILM